MIDLIFTIFQILTVIAVVVSIPILFFIWANPRPPRK
jgi:hypothetical protein